MDSLRASIQKMVGRNPSGVIDALKKSGVEFSAEEETALRGGNLDSFSDQELSQRFSNKVLGLLSSSYGFSTVDASENNSFDRDETNRMDSTGERPGMDDELGNKEET